MTSRLNQLLHDVADAAPPVRVPPLLFDRARRTRRRRFMAVLGAVVAAIGLAAVPVAGFAPSAPTPTPGSAEGLPTRVVSGPSTLIELSPVPRALVVFANLDHGLTVVGPKDVYRDYERAEWTPASELSPTFLLSPDGRYLLMPHWESALTTGGRLLDITTARLSTVDIGLPLAWAPQGHRAVFVGYDGDPMSDSAVGAEIRVADPTSGQVFWSVRLPARSRAFSGLAVALSHDGSAIAVQTGDTLAVYRQTGQSWGGTGRLAGPAAWLPGDRDLLAADATGALTVLDAATGTPASRGATPLPALPRTAVVAGWRGDVPVAVAHDRVTALTNPPTVLMTAPDNGNGLQIATDALDRPPREPGPPDRGGPTVGWGWRNLPAAAFLVLIALVVTVWRLWRHRRRGR